ncbi:AMP-binding protein [Budviciaceae bacterium BWR-B9]|uniref:AMP-binding protein n=1 Tax=Limnobaculum allomyrinae TaxID=2791986 RepID=A0ABS1IP18_9GAMM|nr:MULTISPECIES: AMP-binding protein [Limnobaculum]MBK5143050.1 AMP-binding protein [Limnobaculum allomyrinae]MBV7693380.1 AMP-binding protein [Limnobaculum sp. M2-1]
MNKFKLLRSTGLLSFKGISALIASIRINGISLMALLGYSARRYPERKAVQDENQSLSYQQLYQQSRAVAGLLMAQHQITPGQQVAIICRNHASLLKALFASSAIGADICLINSEISHQQLASFIRQYQFHLIIHDAELSPIIQLAGYGGQCLPVNHESAASIESYSQMPINPMGKITYGPGKIVVLTGGTRCEFKPAVRKPSLFAFINPLIALLDKLKLAQYRSLYIATPIYHGFGLATLCIATLLGSTIYLKRRFEAQQAAELINQQQIEVVTLVPLMLSRMLHSYPANLKSLRCIISGGAALSPALVNQTQTLLGKRLFNLYGTSEAGVCTIATPDDLVCAAGTIGLPIDGLTICLRDTSTGQLITRDNTVGLLQIQCRWAAQQTDDFVTTGDLAFRDANGYYFLNGRNDDMIVSGGENIYPIELEKVLAENPLVRECVVIGIEDKEFGQRLKAYVVAQPARKINAQELIQWLKPRVARYQMPVSIELIEEIPLTAVGKPDTRKLTHLSC